MFLLKSHGTSIRWGIRLWYVEGGDLGVLCFMGWSIFAMMMSHEGSPKDRSKTVHLISFCFLVSPFYILMRISQPAMITLLLSPVRLSGGASELPNELIWVLKPTYWLHIKAILTPATRGISPFGIGCIHQIQLTQGWSMVNHQVSHHRHAPRPSCQWVVWTCLCLCLYLPRIWWYDAMPHGFSSKNHRMA